MSILPYLFVFFTNNERSFFYFLRVVFSPVAVGAASMFDWFVLDLSFQNGLFFRLFLLQLLAARFFAGNKIHQ